MNVRTATRTSARHAALVAALALTVTALPAFGQAPPTETETLAVTATATSTAPLTTLLPPVLTTSFPPGPVCLVASELCAATNQIGLPGQIPIPETPGLPVSTAVPDGLTVALLGGQPAVTSYVLFDLPTLAVADRGRFELELTEALPAVAVNSPLVRALSVAAISAATGAALEQKAPDPAQLLSAIEAEAAEAGVPGVEACGVVEGWAAGSITTPEDEPELDCLFYGATGVRGDDGVWRFDLTFLADAWRLGILPNHGVALRAIAAENLAYGDPEPTANGRVVFATRDGLAGTPTVTVAAIAPEATSTGGTPSQDVGGVERAAPSSAAAPSSGTSSGSGSTFVPSSAQGGGPGGPAPEGVPAPGAVTSPAVPSGTSEQVAAPLVPGTPTGGFPIWLALLLLFAGSVAYQHVLMTTRTTSATAPRSGATTRLFAR